MTKYTPLLNLPYPESSDAPRGWEQIQALATAVEGVKGGYAACYLKSAFTTGTGGVWERLPVQREFGTSDMEDAATGGVKVGTAGVYLCTLTMRVTGQAGAYIGGAAIAVNSTAAAGGIFGVQYMANTSAYSCSGTSYTALAAGDTVTPIVYGAGKAIAITTARWTITYLGPATTEQINAHKAEAAAQADG